MKNIAKVVNIHNINDTTSDFAFWQNKSPEERLATLESIRTEYNTWSKCANQRLQRVYKIVKQK